MSSILLDTSTMPLFQEVNASGGLDIEGQQNASNEFFISGDGNDSVIGGLKSDTIEAGDGDDFISGLDGDDELLGEGGDDTIIGGGGDDLLDGGTGDDLLDGGTGVDTMTGGSGNDIFQFSADNLIPGEIDEVVDFNLNELGEEDLIRLQGIGSDAIVEYNSETGFISVNGEDIIQLNPGLNITGLNITIDNSDGDDTWDLF